jgi:F-type H+-transporting ATPase subunit b
VQPRPSAKNRREQLQKQLERLRQAKGALPPKGDAKPADPGFAKLPRIEKDDHGFCPGHGVDQRPEDINLVHGWLGIDNAQAEPRPRVPPRDPNLGYFENFKAQWPYWKWRITPYPYRFEDHDNPCDPRNEPIPLLANLVNLGALMFLLVRFGRKPAAEGLQRRRERIMREIDEARALKKKAKDRLAGYEDDLDQLDDKRQAVIEQYEAEGEVERTRILQEMGETRDRMMADAEFRIAQESKQARTELSHDALESALTAAEELLKAKVTDGDRQRLADEYLEQIGEALARDTVGRGTEGGGEA